MVMLLNDPCLDLWSCAEARVRGALENNPLGDLYFCRQDRVPTNLMVLASVHSCLHQLVEGGLREASFGQDEKVALAVKWAGQWQSLAAELAGVVGNGIGGILSAFANGATF